MTRPPRIRQLNKPRPEGTLKQSMAALVEANGGITRVADLLGDVRKSQVQRITDDAESDEFRLGQVRLLERFCGQPIVTAFMAMEAHCALIPLDPAGDDPLDIDFARYAKESAQLFEAYIAAMRDRTLTAKEAGRLKAQWLRVIGALGAMLQDFDEAMKEGPR